MPASVIAERIGWTGSISWLRENIARLRPEYAPADPADRLVWVPGDAVQCDLWFPPVKILTGAGQQASLPVLVMVAACSRFIAAVMLPSRTTADLVAGMWLLLRDQLRAVPRRLVWDNEAGIGRRGYLTGEVTSLIGVLGCRLVQCKPYDPETKGTHDIFCEVTSVAKDAPDPPAMRRLLEYAEEGDAIVLWRIDRLGQSLTEILSTVSNLADRGITIHSVQDGIDPSTIHGRL